MSLIFKIIGAVLVVCASFSFGCLMSQKLYKRRDFLKSFTIFLSSLSTNIRYDSSDIFTLVSRSCKTCELEFLAVEYTQNCGKSFEMLWNQKISEIPKQCALTDSDIQLLYEFGSALGKTDVEGQSKHIRLYVAEFENQLENAQQAIVKKSKLYKTMGFFVGSAAALMMI